MIDDVRRIPMFQGAPEAFLEWISDDTSSMVVWTLEPGEEMFRQETASDYAYHLLDGEIEISEQSNGESRVLARIAAGPMGGRITLTPASPCPCTARAIRRSRILGIPNESMRRVFRSQMEIVARQREKMSALNNLSAGLAHHLNNPSAAARRGAGQLGETVQSIYTLTIRLQRHQLTADHWTYLEGLQHSLWDRATQDRVRATPFESRVREDEIEQWLEFHQVPDPWDLAPFLAWGGLDATRLDEIAGRLPKAARADAVAWISGILVVGELVQVLGGSTAAISEVVNTIKAYTHMDQALEAEIDVHEGLESTLTILQSRLEGMRVERDFDRTLPGIHASGAEFNQVWTNLIENAIDATDGHGRLAIRTYRQGNQLVVEFADDGVGIPDDARPRIYEPFFTTKAEGAGLGLGLNIAWRIVTEKYHGELDVESRPGDTRFRVGLPLPEGSTGG